MKIALEADGGVRVGEEGLPLGLSVHQGDDGIGQLSVGGGGARGYGCCLMRDHLLYQHSSSSLCCRKVHPNRLPLSS